MLWGLASPCRGNYSAYQDGVKSNCDMPKGPPNAGDHTSGGAQARSGWAFGSSVQKHVYTDFQSSGH